MKRIITRALLLMLALSVVLPAIIFAVPLTIEAEDTVEVSLSFSDGRGNVIFEPVSDKTAEVNVSGCIVLPGPEFRAVITSVTDGNEWIDEETLRINGETQYLTFTGWQIMGTTERLPAKTVFQPGDVITPGVLEEYATKDANGNTSLSFVAVFGRCWFAQNPYKEMVYKREGGRYVLDTENCAEPTAASDENSGLSAETPMATLPAAFIKIREANRNVHFDDAYDNVLVLTGNLDYYMDSDYSAQSRYFGYGVDESVTASNLIYTSVTFKSLIPSDDQSATYTLRHKGKGYGAQVYCNLRFDNVKFERIAKGLFGTQTVSAEFQLYANLSLHGDLNHYFETTARLVTKNDTPMNTLRPNEHELVVLNGGYFTGVQINYSSGDSSGRLREWFVGRNTQIGGSLTCGTTSQYTSNITENEFPFSLTVTGGSIKNVYGSSSGMNALCAGDRTFRFFGNQGSSTEYNPSISGYVCGGGYQARLFGDIDISVIGCTKIANIYGGGYFYTATTYGNVSVLLQDSIVSGNLFGGGYNGNTEKVSETYAKYVKGTDASGEVVYEPQASSPSTKNLFRNPANGNTLADKYSVVYDGDDSTNYGGDVHIELNNSTVRGDIFGSGTGASQVIETSNSISLTSGWYDEGVLQIPEIFKTQAEGFPSYDAETGRVLIRKYYGFGWNTNARTTLTAKTFVGYAYLSPATVENVSILIDGSTVGTVAGNGKGNVYGGGSIAKVLGRTEIAIQNGSKIFGSVYGGGDGVTKPGKVTVYSPAADYSPPSYKVTDYTTNDKGAKIPNAVTLIDQTPKAGQLPSAQYSWSGDETLREQGGVDTTNHRLYSPNTEGLGSVAGNTAVSVGGSGTRVYGSVFGGGNKGIVFGSTTVTVDSGATVAAVYAGGNQASVNGNTELTVDGGTLESAFGANNLSGIVGGTVSVNVSGGTVTNLYGGGNQAAYERTPSVSISGGSIINLYGGGLSASVGGGSVSLSGGTVGSAFGGGDVGDTNGNIMLTVSGTASVGSLYGGANQADVTGNVELTLENGTATSLFGGNNLSGTISGTISVQIENGAVGALYSGGNQADYNGTPAVNMTGGTVTNLYGGGLSADVPAADLQISGGNVTQNVYGGGYAGDVSQNTSVTLSGGTVNGSVYGGGQNGDAGGTSITFSAGEIGQNIYGGGYAGDVSQNTSVTLSGGTVNGSVYGGGYAGHVSGNTSVTLSGGTVNGSVYGGGCNGNVLAGTAVSVTSGRIGGSLYGGGYAGTANTTAVTLQSDSPETALITVANSVFGGGEGATATVYQSSTVLIDLPYVFTATEEPITTGTNDVASGEIKTSITLPSGDQCFIGGSVYGGGDLGMMGVGEINLAQNTATITTPATTSVTIKSGHILGSVFGGGNGVPPEGVNYDLYMGAVFGNTTVTVKGGYIEGNLYGGGTQSRLYGGENADLTAAVLIEEYTTDAQSGEPYSGIAIKGSVFGGGDRGNSATSNASVPTTVGNVSVTINGNPGGSKIYFMDGGVYGDGNLCLVSGKRSIAITNFTTASAAENGIIPLKTFYSLQRADEVILTNSDFVLLGAVDLVEEGDASVYSINRINSLSMKGGSTIKLSQLVKALASISSDYGPDTNYINKGNNGENSYTAHGGSDPENKLDPTEEDKYRQSEYPKNVICVANGLYLEIRKADGTYGPVEGLFTLQLLYANPGEGGGFVYADIATTTGDFVCNTSKGFTYKKADGVNADNVTGYYIRLPGAGYQQATEYHSGMLYYKRTEAKGYMAIVDTVGGELTDAKYEYYYWYINGSTIKYSNVITGYIGSDERSTEISNLIPQTTSEVNYVLYAIYETAGNTDFSDALHNGTYELTTKEAADLVDQEISLEILIGGESCGFVTYDQGSGTWGIKKGDSTITGYLGNISDINSINSHILRTYRSEAGTDTVTFRLNKSPAVNSEVPNMSLNLDIDLYAGSDVYTDGASTLIFQNVISIVRLVPKQTQFADMGRYFAGVSFNNTVHITHASSFTAEYQTKYIAMAFPTTEDATMQWVLSTKGCSFYFNAEQGTYLTVDSEGNTVNKSAVFESILLSEPKTDGSGKTYYTYTHDTNEYQLTLFASTEGIPLPRGTKITMVDLTGEQAEYYYYTCTAETSEINLSAFMLMGTQTTIEHAETKPAFMREYADKQKTATRVNERIVFVFDFSEVGEWSSGGDATTFEGILTLQHLYKNVDIMDYVEAVPNTDGTGVVYGRSAPKATTFSIHKTKEGINSFTVSSVGTMCERGETDVQLTITVGEDYVNTRFNEGKFSLKLELLGTDNNPIEMPNGICCDYNGSLFHLGENGKFIIIPISEAGTHTITIQNALYSLKDFLAPQGIVNAVFRLTLYSAPDPAYYNEMNTDTSASVTFTLTEEPTYALKLSCTEQVVSLGGSLLVQIDAEAEGDSNAAPKVSLYRKSNGVYEKMTVNMEDLLTVNGSEYEYEYAIEIREGIFTSGTYRLVCEFGDKTAFLPFIVQ